MQLNGLLFPFAEMLHLKESPYSLESKAARYYLEMPFLVRYHSIVLGRFQNSSVPVLNFSEDTVSVLTGFTKCCSFGPGSKDFGSTVLTVLNYHTNYAQNLVTFCSNKVFQTKKFYNI